ncbi:hypothetical protein LOZ53_003221 [Ophidiomyces ophidiicola]|nr:hypothetical protein LOZ55_005225 [Ophidiomyces ophidiicola]KAI1983848.1 hypothetical protein LOZ54_004759 [Ophidiomyces ophidiicola]KAI1990342.1 hypothetical protein LOZ53_003221 [Ophidiomyces ophidiicola]KAI1998214.1 hypothetical protein LOZ51_002892 [Ophidiomyces ophidiicola]
MSTRRLIVFGATENQRGSVVHAVTNDPVRSSAFHTTRTVTRQAGSPAAKPLHSHGIEEIWANMNSPASLEYAAAGAHTTFLVTKFWQRLDSERKCSQGQKFADVAKEALAATSSDDYLQMHLSGIG